MNNPVEERLRQALTEAGSTVRADTIAPLRTDGRRAFRIDPRFAVAAVAVLAVAFTGVTLFGARPDGAQIAVAPAPEEADLAVYLCHWTSAEPPCEGGAATDEQKAVIERTLWELPGVAQVYLESRHSAYERLHRSHADDQDLLARVRAEDMRESFRLVLRPGADPRLVIGSLKGVAGVYEAIDLRASHDLAGAGIAVFLCDGGDSPNCADEVTAQQKKAVRQAIKAMPGIESSRFEDKEAAFERFTKSYADNKTMLDKVKVSDMSESFRITPASGADREEILATLRRLPGVSRVIDAACVTGAYELYKEFGIPSGDGTC